MPSPALFYTVIPLLTNGSLALVAFFIFHGTFADNLWLCYSVAGIATAASLVSMGGVFLRDIGPRQLLVSLISQGGVLIFVFAGIYRGFGLMNGSPAQLQSPVEPDIALYFSVVTWTTLGYGDFSPADGLQLLAAIQAGLGYLFLGLIVGLTANLISNR